MTKFSTVLLFATTLNLIIIPGFSQITNVKAGLWADPTSWSNSNIPNDTTNVVLNYDVSIEMNATCKSLHTNGHAVIVYEGYLLNVSGENSINGGNTISSDTFPNKVGDWWVYNVTDYTVKRSGSDSPSVQYTVTVSIIDSVELPEGIKANVWVYYYPGFTDTNYVYQSADTVHFTDINPSVYSIYGKQYIVPIYLHQSWQYTAPGFQSVTVDSQANIIAGSNNFDSAFHIYGTGGMPDASFIISEWFKNNVGIVKKHFDPIGELIDPRHLTDWSLVSFHLK